MSTDKKLLKLAAKAAGIEYSMLGDFFRVYYTEPISGMRRYQYWNPLTDDGDALRLAVKLGLNVFIGAKGTDVERDENCGFHICECSSDPYAATRRAIVRAAAEIGRSM